MSFDRKKMMWLIYVCCVVYVCLKILSDVEQRHTLLYDLARLHIYDGTNGLLAKFYPIFCAAASVLCVVIYFIDILPSYFWLFMFCVLMIGSTPWGNKRIQLWMLVLLNMIIQFVKHDFCPILFFYFKFDLFEVIKKSSKTLTWFCNI